MSHDVDAVIIGSGAGGLTAALCLARAGQRVLVLEQHYVPGGWCHSFQLGGYQFSPGVHYVGELGPDGSMRRIYEGLGIANDLFFFELNPDGYDHVLLGAGAEQRRFDIPKGREAFAARLRERFPSDARGVDRFLRTAGRIDDQLKTCLRVRGPLDALLLPLRAPSVLRNGWSSLERLLDRCGVRDPFARAVLSVQGGDYGLPPSLAPAVLHAGLMGHYANGGYYPKGGGRALPRAMLRGLRRHGGELKVRSEVARILVEGRGRARKAVGVRLADGTEVRAKAVISNADPAATYRLLGPEHQSRRLRRRLERTRYSISVASLFLAVDVDLRALGFDSGNYWFSRSPDIETIYTLGKRPDPSAKVPGLFVTITTLKDPTKPSHGHHVLEAFAFYDWETFAPWANTPTGERGADYEAFKERLADAMLAAVDDVIPGVSDRVVFRELGTPLTNAHFVAATRGSIYGTEKTLGQMGPLGYPLRTELPGLFLCGASTLSHGVAGATLSGIAVAKTVLGCRTSDLMDDEGQELRIAQADDPGSWPADVRRQVEQTRRTALSRA